MKTCPGCGELLGDFVKSCFKCNYNYTLGRIITEQEKEYEKKQQLLEQEEKEKAKKLKKEQRDIQLKNNPLYEYKTVVINNYDDGHLV